MKPQAVQDWRGFRDGPWPAVRVRGQIENAEQEWVHTNGTGAYAMSTIALMHTRREHGLLVASLGEHLERYVVLSHVEATLEVGDRTFRLSTHQFPNVAPTPGYRLLESFAQDPLPRWVYRIGKGSLERTVSLVRGSNTVVLGFTWTGKHPARITLRPLMPMRRSGELMREHGAMLQKVTLRSGEVEVQPVRGLPSVTFRHFGVFMGSPDWWRRFEYLDDRGRFETFQEDMWCPGIFEIQIEPRQTAYLVAGVGAMPDAEPAELVMNVAQHWLSQDPGEQLSPEVRALSVAAEDFIVEESGSILAGLPWLDVWSRDVLLSLPGIHLSRGRKDLAQRCLECFARKLRGGLLPQRLSGENVDRVPAVDSTLWFFEAARIFAERCPEEWDFVRRVLYPALRRIFVRVSSKRRDHVWLAEDGLVENGTEGAALTWMDSRTGTHLFTPRRGLAVELQALWSRGCETLARMAHRFGDTATESAARRAREAVQHNFRDRFWCNETGYPFDCVSAERDAGDAWADPSIRPNALIALAVDRSLFEDWQARAIVERAERDLVIERGVRSLSPHDAAYVGHIGGTIPERQAAYHQGTSWPYLFAFYARASLELRGDSPDERERLKGMLSGVLDAGPALGQVAQTADGDAPHAFRGCPAQAFSVGIALDLLQNELSQPRQLPEAFHVPNRLHGEGMPGGALDEGALEEATNASE